MSSVGVRPNFGLPQTRIVSLVCIGPLIVVAGDEVDLAAVDVVARRSPLVVATGVVRRVAAELLVVAAVAPVRALLVAQRDVCAARSAASRVLPRACRWRCGRRTRGFCVSKSVK